MHTHTYRTTALLLMLALLISSSGLAAAQPPTLSATDTVQAITETDTTLDLCMNNEPSSLYLYAESRTLWQSLISSAIYDGPIDSRTFSYQPVIFKSLPTLDAPYHGPASINAPAPGTMVQPAFKYGDGLEYGKFAVSAPDAVTVLPAAAIVHLSTRRRIRDRVSEIVMEAPVQKIALTFLRSGKAGDVDDALLTRACVRLVLDVVRAALSRAAGCSRAIWPVPTPAKRSCDP